MSIRTETLLKDALEKDLVRILIVEDALTDYELAQREIRAAVENCVFERVDSQKDFLNALDIFKPDVVLSDYSMPRFDGMKALKLLQEHSPFTPLILWTGSLSEDIAVESMKAGANNYVIKENIKRLGPAVVHALDERRLQIERKLAEEQLRYDETLLRHVLDTSPAVIFVKDRDSTILLANKKMASFYNLSVEEVVGRRQSDLHQKFGQRAEEVVKWLADDRDVIDSGMIKRMVETGTDANGNLHWFETVKFPIDLGDGNRGVLILSEDVTERRRSEEQIQRQVKRLNALRTIDVAMLSSFDLRVVLDVVLQQIPLQVGIDASAIWLVNLHLRTMELAASRGFRSDHIKHIQLKSNEAYTGRAAVEQRTIHVIEGGKELSRFPHLSKEGFVEYYGIPLIVKGEVKGVLEVYHRTPLSLNAEQLDFLETLAGLSAIATENSQLFHNLQRANFELEQRVAERTAELNRTNFELERANRAKDEFLATMSHELRTPLNSILGLSETLLEQRRDPLSERQQKSLQIIETSGRHLLELINDVLDLSKIDAGKLDYYPQVIEVDALCRSSMAFVKEQATRKSIDLRYEEDQAVSEIFADPRRLKQILINLLTNAVKFTPDGGYVILKVQADADQDRIQFSIMDNGIGIAGEDLKKLFQPFVQVDSSLTREFEGTGLGLALVQKLADLHGGSVQAESEPGNGSRFTVSIPWRNDIVTQEGMGKPKSEGSTHQQKNGAEASVASPKATILLAEDNVANVLTITEYLESHGYKVVNAQDGITALEMAEKNDPDLILMDIQMPVLDGLEAIRRLRKIPRFASTPIIAITALAMPGDRESCLEAGADEYMSKPVSLKLLAESIHKFLGRE